MNFKTYIPIIEKQEVTECGLNQASYIFSQLWLARLGERAKRMYCDPRIVIAAQKHAVYLNSRTGDTILQSMHIGQNGTMPNDRLRAEGYKLPDYYPTHDNNVESCALESPGEVPEDVLQLLFNSPTHYNHLTGQGWFKDHIVWGIGHVGLYWVIDIAPPE